MFVSSEVQELNQRRLCNIDFFRIVLINAIIVHHFYSAVTGIGNAGGFAVEFFFIISGFLLNLNYKEDRTVRSFMGEKLIRFMPLLLCTSLILSVGPSFNFQKFLADLFLLQRTGLYNEFGYNQPAWYVSVLFWALLFVFYLRKVLSAQKTNLVLFPLTFFLLVLSVQDHALLYGGPRILRGLSEIGLGYFCAEFVKMYPVGRVRSKSWLITVLELALVPFLIVLLFSCYSVTNRVAILFLMGMSVVLFYFKAGYLSSILNKTIFTKLSVFVLPIFLTHALLYSRRLGFLDFSREACEGDAYLICMWGSVASWILGIFTYYCILRPCENYLSRKFKKKGLI